MKQLAYICGLCACLSMLAVCTAQKVVLDDESLEVASQKKKLAQLGQIARGRNGLTEDQLLNSYFR